MGIEQPRCEISLKISLRDHRERVSHSPRDLFWRFQNGVVARVGSGVDIGECGSSRKRNGVERGVEIFSRGFEVVAIRYRHEANAVELERKRIDEDVAALDREMQMGTGRASGRSDVADELS